MKIPAPIGRSVLLTSTMSSIALSSVLLSIGCGGDGGRGHGAKWDSSVSDMTTYATQIPLYPGANAEDAMGSDTYGDTKADHMKGLAIWFQSEATREELEAWYDEKLAEADREQTEDGYTKYTMIPDGADENEEIGVIVEEDGMFRVYERVRPENSRS